ncbi:DinB family protein [Chitinophaga dinghuensis]|uniref:DinB family protein n=1 Tax=Chitinophaga dinghuensis TaxID=1539050 RepID=A0A327W678_9BACT|nr:DinB family protein [Chitinophaga dinghuensis]RAJ83675.1 DinB family protein [Chitinophaga dinghuensis]
METAELIHSIDQVNTQLQDIISSFTTEQLNTVPFEGSWTAAQVAEHIEKSVSPGMLYGTVENRTQQEDKLQGIRQVFLNYDIKMKSPDFILPSDKIHTKEELLADVSSRWQQLKEAAQTLDLSATCVDFEIPGIGYLTRYELIGFFVVHTTRHIHQLKNIHSYFKK